MARAATIGALAGFAALLTFAFSGASADVLTDLPSRGIHAKQQTSGSDNVKPFMVARPAGGVYLAWAHTAGGQTQIVCSRSADGGTYSAPVVISTAGMFLDLGAENAPNLATDSHGGLYVVWTAGSAPAPIVPATNHAHEHGDAGATGKKSAGHPPRPGNLNIWLSRSDDDGKTFSAPIRVNDDADGAEHRFPTVAVDHEGAICVAWLDKRKKQTDGSDMARVYFARSIDRGSTFSKNIDATSGQPYPICHCCRVAIDPDTTHGITIAFRNDINDLRDIFLLHSKNGGQDFEAPVAIEQTHWIYPSCPMDGPSIATDAAGVLHAAWMTMAPGVANPLFGTSEKADCKILYTTRSSTAPTPDAPTFLAAGHHPRVTVTPAGQTYIAYHQGQSLVLCAVTPGLHGKISAFQLSDGKGTSGYPAIVSMPDGSILCAWQEKLSTDSTQIFTIRLNLSQGVGSTQVTQLASSNPHTNSTTQNRSTAR